MSRYHLFLTSLFLIAWVWAAINPLYPQGWLLENLLVFIFVPVILIAGRYFKLSDTSYTFITLFLILHVIGSHYTYALVPFGDDLQAWFGANRNLYDRFVHFCFGLLLAYPIREIFMRLASVRGLWAHYFSVELIVAFSALYEIVEYLMVMVVDPQAGLAFLGTQGDIWDAQRDMLLATLGAVIASAGAYLLERRRRGLSTGTP